MSVRDLAQSQVFDRDRLVFVVALHIARASAAATPRLGRQRRLALDEPELSPRELATRFADTKNYFASEASVYRLLKEHDLIASPAYIVIKAADEFKDKTGTKPALANRLHLSRGDRLGLVLPQHDIGRLLALHHRLEALHDDEGRDVTETLDLALQASGLNQVHVVHRPRLLSDNGPSYISSDLAEWLDKRNMGHVRGAHAIRRHRARSNAGIKRSRTASCWKTIICPATSKPGSTRSSTTTTIAVIMRAWTISRRPTSTSAADKPFY